MLVSMGIIILLLGLHLWRLVVLIGRDVGDSNEDFIFI